MTTEATLRMLKMQRLMGGLTPADQQSIASEIHRTYGKHVGKHAVFLNGTPPENTRVPDENTSEKHAENTTPELGLGATGVQLGSVSRSKKAIAKNPESQSKALEILQFLNDKTGRSYRPVEENLRFIRARLATCSVEDTKGVIARKTRAWKGTTQEVFLRPKTLFNATNFEQYLGEQPNA